MSLSNYNIFITGSDKGIGLGLVKSFLKEGSTVIATARDPSSAQELNDLKSYHEDRLHIFKLNIVEEEDHVNVKKALQEANINELDIIIANAGTATEGHPHDPPVESSIEDMVDVFRTNAIGTLLTFRSYYDILRGPKLLLANSSRLGSLSQVQTNQEGNVASYRASKAALNMFALCFSVEPAVVSAGIKVIIFHPGHVKTDMGLSGDQSPDINVEESSEGILKLINEAVDVQTKGDMKKGGESSLQDFVQAFNAHPCVFVNYDGNLIPW